MATTAAESAAIRKRNERVAYYTYSGQRLQLYCKLQDIHYISLHSDSYSV